MSALYRQMASSALRSLPLFLFVAALFYHRKTFVAALFLLSSPATATATASSSCSSPVIFNFGDSNSDTGGLVAGLGYTVTPPNGRSFFHRSTGRLSDGRLLIDFLCQSLNTKLLLNAYMESVGSDFRNGANFAVVGSPTLPRNVPFSLHIQVMQFLHFMVKARSLHLLTSGSRGPIDAQGFQNALYMIDIGQVDISKSFEKNIPYAQIIRRIPLMIAEIKDAVKRIYGEGGRKFWIHNTGPLGCLPQKLAMTNHTPKDVDSNGCISSYNAAAKVFNVALLNSTQEMQYEMKNATLVYVDIYAIKYDMISNAAKYGFSKPLMACCGYGGPPYNYDIKVSCGKRGYQVCEAGSRSLSWDGMHYTEAANAIVAKEVLSTKYSTPKVSFDFFCKE